MIVRANLLDMRTEFVSVVFDRKKHLSTKGEGKVELCIYLGRNERKFVTIKTCNPISWERYQKSNELRKQFSMYHQVVQKMYDSGEEMTVANLNYHLGIEPAKPKTSYWLLRTSKVYVNGYLLLRITPQNKRFPTTPPSVLPN